MNIRGYTILIRSHQNDSFNLSPALIQLHVERRPLTGLHFDVQRKIKLILGKGHFRGSDSNVVTFTPQNYASKSNFRKRFFSAMIMKLDQARKCKKKNMNNSRNQCQTCGSSTCLRHCLKICALSFNQCRSMIHD